MLTRAQIQFVKALHQKKERALQRLFFVEGTKGVEEFLGSSFVLHSLYATREWIEERSSLVPTSAHVASTSDLERISALKTASPVLAIFHIPENTWDEQLLEEGLVLALDGVSDPGNMGTLLRTADWFGVRTILCSPETVEVWNPKVVQATMGSLTRVRVFVTPLIPVLQKAKAPILVTVLSGKDVGSYFFPVSGVLVLGSESHGVSPEVQKLATERLSIPAYGATHPESLNVALAGGICLYEYRKQFP